MSNVTSQSELTTKEIVEQAISDYHESILPYLNGMVPTIANKFDKANLYSTDEQIVGRWIDGKPLYQKTFDMGSTKTIPKTWWDTGISGVNFNIDSMIHCFGCNESTDASTVPLCAGCSNANIMLMSVRGDYDGASYARYFVLQYTKTTDEAIAIGSDTDYSTTEKIVGTWIDGKPLYQKTVDCGALPNATSIEMVHNISNIDKIINTYGIGINNASISIIVGGCSTNSNHTGDIGLAVTRSHINLQTYIDRSNYNAYVTLQYTKTTDV